MLSLFPFKLFHSSSSSSKNQQGSSEVKDEFAFKFRETENEFLDIALMGKSKNKSLAKKTELRDQHSCNLTELPRELQEEVDLSVSEMIEFQNHASGRTFVDDKKRLELQQKLDNVRAGYYSRNLEHVPLHQFIPDDYALDSFEEEKFDPKLFRKIKVDKRRSKNILFSKANRA